MFSKYFELVKTLFNNVFSSSGESVSILDYFYVIGMTLAIIAVVILGCLILFGSVKLPILTYKKLIKKLKTKRDELLKQIKSDDAENYTNLCKEYEKVEQTIHKRFIIYILGIILIYIPLLIPTLLFILSCVMSWI